MKTTIVTILTLFVLTLSGCSTKSGSAVGGAIGGAAGGAGSYEYRMNEELKRVEDEYKAGKIDQREYEIRKDQIERMSLVK